MRHCSTIDCCVWRAFAVPNRLALVAMLLAACGGTTTTTLTGFSAPSAVVIAGSGHDALFIANAEDNVLEVATLGESLTKFTLLHGDSVAFPLRISTGPRPIALAASPDGRYVIVLDAVGEGDKTTDGKLAFVRLIDADALVPARGTPADGQSVGATVTAGLDANSAPTALVAAPSRAPDCSAGCRYYVTASGTGEVVVLTLTVTDGLPRLEAASPTIKVVDAVNPAAATAPSALAVAADDSQLFVADALSTRVLRLDVKSGAPLEAIEVGSVPGPLAVLGSLLLVGRPTFRDVLVVDISAANSATVVDANPLLTPLPQCLARCDAAFRPTASECAGAHAADRALCAGMSTGTDLAAGVSTAAGGAYPAVYLGATATHLVPMVQSDDVGMLTVPCSSADGDATRSYTAYVAVATLEGAVQFIGLYTEALPQVLAPELVTTSFCRTPSIVASQPTTLTTAVPPLSRYLAACLPAPARARFACLHDPATDDVAAPGGVVLQRGPAASGVWEFEWEGRLVQRSGGGTLTADGMSLTALGVDLLAAGVQDNDILVITSQRTASCPLAASDLLERRVLAPSATGTRVTFAFMDDPSGGADIHVPPSCFLDPANVAFAVRAPDAFLVHIPRTSLSARLPAGGEFGPGGAVARTLGLSFALLSDPDASADPSMTTDLLKTRGRVFGFTITEDVTPVRAAAKFNTRVPADLELLRHPTAGYLLFLTLVGSPTAVVGFSPFDAATFGSDSAYVVIQH